MYIIQTEKKKKKLLYYVILLYVHNTNRKHMVKY